MTTRQPTWLVKRPSVFRYLESQWVDEFFRSGALRLSSLRRFASHPDERRRDETEGKFSLLIVSDRDTVSAMSIFVAAQVPESGYVLCSSHFHYRPLADKFQADAAIEISDTTGFAAAVARALPSFVGGTEGPCIYQRRMILERDIHGFELNQYRDQKGQLQLSEMFSWISSHVGIDHFFLKRDVFVPEAEYRFVWMCADEVAEHIDIVVPEAIKYCRRPRPLPSEP